ncbi:hypothetical protein BgiBS90_003833 [Biomphalaria glabrata]|nr:hypothetical protein BgiBS90_003833 [Biomphalaria glabrata]
MCTSTPFLTNAQLHSDATHPHATHHSSHIYSCTRTQHTHMHLCTRRNTPFLPHVQLHPDATHTCPAAPGRNTPICTPTANATHHFSLTLTHSQMHPDATHHSSHIHIHIQTHPHAQLHPDANTDMHRCTHQTYITLLNPPNIPNCYTSPSLDTT